MNEKFWILKIGHQVDRTHREVVLDKTYESIDGIFEKFECPECKSKLVFSLFGQTGNALINKESSE